MYKIKDAAKRGSALLGAVGLFVAVGSSALSSLTATASADALNPLTQRSLTLSSSSPGWSYTDGSGNSTYAPPNSGANGKQTGNFYSFNPSTTGKVNALTFQYCTFAAGLCAGPGDNSPLTHANDSSTDTAQTSDLNVVVGDGTTTVAPAEVSSAHWTTISSSGSQIPPEDGSQGNFVVLVDNGSGLTYSPDWVMTASNQEESSSLTSQNNMITLTNVDSTGDGIQFTGAKQVVVKFFGTDDNYITNPGAGAFFVKINDYEAPTNDTATPGTFVFTDPTDINPVDHIDADTGSNQYVIDGGVTVANVMNQSIEIQTKVLETMQFSVGTVDPDTLTSDGSTTAGPDNELYAANGDRDHGACDNILTGLVPGDAVNLLRLGTADGEYSLATDNTFGAHSYWRLSSNSSAGASVFYSGSTLHDTEGDDINPMTTTASSPVRGTEQFGLAIDNTPFSTDSTEPVNHDNTVNTLTGPPTTVNYDYGADTGTTMDGALDNVDSSHDWAHAVSALSAHNPQLFPLKATDGTSGTTNYSDGGGTNGYFNGALPSSSVDSEFAFDPNANTSPALIATEPDQVVDCVTAKMRYVANIAAITPAGIYTTKINYIAAPQY